MKKIILFCLPLYFVLTLCGCTPHPAQAPCADYGKWCHKVPVNSWDDQN